VETDTIVINIILLERIRILFTHPELGLRVKTYLNNTGRSCNTSMANTSRGPVTVDSMSLQYNWLHLYNTSIAISYNINAILNECKYKYNIVAIFIVCFLI